MKKQAIWLFLGLLVIVSILAVACAAPTPEVVKEEVVVEKEVPVTVVVEKEVVVEKVVIQTVEVEKEVVVEKVVTATPAEPRILTIPMSHVFENVDPAFVNWDDYIGDTILSGLVAFAPGSFDVENDLAEWIEESEDGLEISFKLKEGVMWHKGYGEVTAEDVKFSFERMIDPELGGWYPDDWATLDHVEVIDKYRGTIILSEPYAPLWNSTLPVYSGKVLPKAYMEEVGREEFGTNPIGSGPYIFDEWTPMEKVVLKRNPDYFGDAPYYDEIHMLLIEDTQAAETALEAGEVDFTGIDLASIDRFEADPDFEVTTIPAWWFGWIGMNVENPKLQDINVRLAIRYAIDVPSILQVAYDGQVERETTMIPPGMLGHWEDAPVFDRDVEKAKEYMAKAGLETLDLRMDVDSDVKAHLTTAQVVQENLKDIGINLEINPMDDASFWEIGMGDEGVNMELFAISYILKPDPAWGPMWFVCDQVGVWNWMRWCNEEYDELFHQSIVSRDPAEREQLYIEMEKIWNDAVHAIWITHGVFSYAYRAEIDPRFRPYEGWYQVQFFRPAD